MLPLRLRYCDIVYFSEIKPYTTKLNYKLIQKLNFSTFLVDAFELDVFSSKFKVFVNLGFDVAKRHRQLNLRLSLNMKHYITQSLLIIDYLMLIIVCFNIQYPTLNTQHSIFNIQKLETLNLKH